MQGEPSTSTSPFSPHVIAAQKFPPCPSFSAMHLSPRSPSRAMQSSESAVCRLCMHVLVWKRIFQSRKSTAPPGRPDRQQKYTVHAEEVERTTLARMNSPSCVSHRAVAELSYVHLGSMGYPLIEGARWSVPSAFWVIVSLKKSSAPQTNMAASGLLRISAGVPVAKAQPAFHPKGLNPEDPYFTSYLQACDRAASKHFACVSTQQIPNVAGNRVYHHARIIIRPWSGRRRGNDLIACNERSRTLPTGCRWACRAC